MLYVHKRPARVGKVIAAILLPLFALLFWYAFVPFVQSTTGHAGHADGLEFEPALVGLHTLTNALIAICYIAISTTLAYLIFKARADVPFHNMFLAFGLFIVSCGIGHLMHVLTLWMPLYWLSGAVMVVTTMSSMAVAVTLPGLLPQIFGLIKETRLAYDRKVQVENANRALEEANSTLERLNSDLATEVKERERAEGMLKHQAFHDPLTGLPNRALFINRLDYALLRGQRHNECVAVLFLDLDNFKLVNDSMGHNTGDALLRTVSERLSECVRSSDTVARLGGDEFTVLLEAVVDVEEATIVARRIAAALQSPVVLDRASLSSGGDNREHQLYISASIGIVMQNETHKQAGDLLREADMAMYDAKSRGKSQFSVFTPTMALRVERHLELESDLRDALARGEFRLYYQPIINLPTGRIVGVEALLRWMHPTRGCIAPQEFIPVAEQSGLIVQIGEWVLHEACRQMLEWRNSEQGGGPGEQELLISINLSPKQLANPKLLSQVVKVVHEYGITPGSLQLEITESAAMSNIEEAISTLKELRQIGVKVALDDFGKGYSALSYLKLLPVDSLKLDHDFVRGLNDNPEDNAIVEATVGMARALGLSVTAEGIETSEQLTILQNMGCRQGQGYYFAKPMPAQELGHLFVQEANLPTTARL